MFKSLKFSARILALLFVFQALAAMLCTAARAQKTPTKDPTLPLLEKLLSQVKPGDKGVQIGDQYFRVDTMTRYRDYLKSVQSGGVSTRAAFDFNGSLRWTNGVVPYRFDPTDDLTHRPPSTSEQRQFEKIVRGWQKAANINFVKRTTQTDYVYVSTTRLSGVNFSWVARSGGAQPMWINNWQDALVLHEAGHSLGLTHEQQRSDRDNYIDCWWWNAIPTTQINFIKVGDSVNKTAYDYDSIMHYDKRSYVLPWPSNLLTLHPKDESYLDTIGTNIWFGEDGTQRLTDFLPPTDEYKKVGTYGYLSPLDRVGIADEYGAPNGITGQVSLNTGGTLPGVRLKLTGGSSVKDTVDRMSMTSVGENPVYNDSTNGYRFVGLPTGSYTVTPTLNGYRFAPVSQTVTVTSGQHPVLNFTATIDENTPPDIAFTTPALEPNHSYKTQPHITGTATDGGSGVHLVRISVSNSDGYWYNYSTGKFETGEVTFNFAAHSRPLTGTFAPGTINWDFSGSDMPVLSEGWYQVHVQAEDNSGNASDWEDRPIVIDKTVPYIEISPLNHADIVADLLKFGGRTWDNLSAITVDYFILENNAATSTPNKFWNGSAWVSSNPNLTATIDGYNWKPAVALPDRAHTRPGRYTLYAKATDKAGNVATKSIDVTRSAFDSTVPNVTITSPSASQVLTSPNVSTITGTASDPETGMSELQIYFERVLPNGGGFQTWDGFAWSNDQIPLATNWDAATGQWSAPATSEYTTYNLPSGPNLPNGQYQIQVYGFNNESPRGTRGISVNFSVDYHPVYTWTGATLRDSDPNNNSNSWGTPANWSPAGTPGVGDVVIIDTGDIVDTTISRTVYALKLYSGMLDFSNGPGASGTIITTNTSEWQGGTLHGIWQNNAGATLNISGAARKTLGDGSIINNDGTINWSGTGEIYNYGYYANTQATINNKSGATFNVLTDGTPFTHDYNISNFNNLAGAKFIKTGGSGTTNIRAFDFNNSGEVRANVGTLEFSERLNLNTGGTLTGSGQYKSTGTVAIDGTSTISGTTFVMVSGMLNSTGAGDLTTANGGVFNWTGGALGGTLNIAAGSTFNISGPDRKTFGDGAVINNNGATNWSGTGEIYNYGYYGNTQATFNNKNGGTFNAQSDAAFNRDYNASNFNNLAGATFTKTGGSGTTTFNWAFNNAGTLKVASGTVALNAGGSSASTLTADSGTFLKFTGGTHTLGNTQLTGAGRIQVDGGTVTANGTVTGTTTAPGSFDVISGTVDGTGTFTGNGTMNWTGGVIGGGTFNIAAGSTFNITGAGRKTMGANSVINNSGTTNWSGTGDIWNYGYYGNTQAIFNNKSGAVFNVLNDGTPFAHDYNTSSFNNEAGARFSKTGGTGTTSFGTFEFNNSGEIEVKGGTLEFSHILNLAAGSVLSGTGIVRSSGTTVAAADITSSANFKLSAGTFTGTVIPATETQPSVALASYSGAGAFDWTGGMIGGTLSFASGTTFNISGAERKTLGDAAVINNSGTVNWSGTGDIWNYGYFGATQATFNNKSGGTFNVLTDGTPFNRDYNNSYFNNQAGAKFVKTGGTGTTSFGTFDFNNSGEVRANVGTLDFSTILNLNNGGTFTGSGQHLKSAGTTTVTGTTTITGSNFTQAAGDFNGPSTGTGTIATSGGGAFNWTGGTLNRTLNIASGANFNISGSARKQFGDAAILNNAGIVTWSGSGDIWNNGYYGGTQATFNNLAGATLNAQSSNGFTQDYSRSTLNNNGTINIGSSTSILNSAWNYAQSSTGVLNVELGGKAAGPAPAPPGTQFDQLKIADSATLGGTLNVSLVNGFAPNGDSFKIVTYGTHTGTFATVNGLNLGNGRSLTTQYNAGDVTLADVITPATTYTISGRVVTSANVAIPNVKISRSGSTTSVLTDSSGNFTFSGVPAGSYNITPSLAQYSFDPTFKGVAVTSANVTGVNFTGTRASYTIKGRITNHSGSALPNLQITCTGKANAVTDANGDYVFNVFAGDYTIAPLITPSLNGVTLFPASRSVSVTTSSLSNQNFTASFTVTGRVATSTGAGIPNIQVRRTAGASSVTVVTDANGNYRFTDVRSGSYTVAPVVTPSLSGVTFFPASTNITVDKANLTNINFTAWFSISGKVANNSGVGIPNIQIKRTAGASTVTTATDANGNYKFTDVRSGNYTLSPNITPAMAGMSLFPGSIPVTVGNANLTNQNFTIWFSISGRITDSATGQGMAGVQVKRTVGSSVVSVFTDANGNYKFTDVRSGDYTITAELNGKTFAPASKPVTVGTQNLTNVNFIGS